MALIILINKKSKHFPSYNTKKKKKHHLQVYFSNTV